MTLPSFIPFEFSSFSEHQQRFTGTERGEADSIVVFVSVKKTPQKNHTASSKIQSFVIGGFHQCIYSLCVTAIQMMSVAVNLVLQPSVLFLEWCSELGPGFQDLVLLVRTHQNDIAIIIKKKTPIHNKSITECFIFLVLIVKMLFA